MHAMPFLLFDGTCAEAMAFYQSSLGGDLTITRLGDAPIQEQAPPEWHDRVTYAHLAGGAAELSATDWLHPTRTPTVGNTVAVYVVGDSSEDLRTVFDRLAVGADPNLLDDLHELPFGTYGHLADRYGVHWFFRGPPAGPSAATR